ncbi:M14 family zinc carboxypeptidase [Marinicella meishanensis]|uniref:M14 family zinc carboxypeptidase n=1 Tax=Marinicella meishanensis TaxID=2873263 RepID=UPI001CBF9BBF|nr:M14 family zinc carboxypeptidase [Marinicella sp. NBU2979]
MYHKLIAFIAAVTLSPSPVQAFSQELPAGDGPWIVLLAYEDKDAVLDLNPDYDLWRIDEKNQTVLLMVDEAADYQQLLDLGFSLKPHDELMRQHAAIREQEFQGRLPIDGFPCYRTVAETYAAMTTMQSTYPQLVTLVDIGDSWHKTEPGGLPGHDMQVVKITNANVIDPNKPILYAMGAIHAREYPTAELVTRFAEHLLANHGVDPDVTWLVDHHEIHLLLQGNPDGREISENQNFPNQRKNRNENHCFGGNQQGVDMNRNFLFRWNQGSGSSSNQCSEVYRGLSAVSEPETTAINEYIKTLFPDDRPDDLVTAAPLTKPGVYLDIHNVAELTLFPFGYSNGAGQAPNHDQLRTLARRMSYFTGYRPEQSNASLGGADGASDDNAYGTLGVAAFTIELGEGGFYSSCSAFENTIWPDNLGAMIYAAKVARMPYITASGPDVIDLPQTTIEVAAGQSFAVSGTATDTRFNGSNGTEATHNITAVKAYLGTPSWQAGAVAIDMTAADGTFNSSTEGFVGSIDTTGLSPGQYTVWFEASDDGAVGTNNGITGVPAAIFIEVLDPANIGTISGLVRDDSTFLPIEQVLVEYAGQQTFTDMAGNYSVQTAATTSDLTFSKAGYFSQSIIDVATMGGMTTEQNVLLEPVCETEFLYTDVEAYSNIGQATTDGWSVLMDVGSNDWRVESGDNNTNGGTRAFVATNIGSTSDSSLVTPEMALTEQAELTFWHKHQFESSNDDYDGGVLEISTNGGTNWNDLGSAITQNGYNGTLSANFQNPLGGRPAFVDTLGSFTEVKVDLSAYDGQTVLIRWRLGTDETVAAGDWKLDDIKVVAAGVCPGPSDLIFADDFEG